MAVEGSHLPKGIAGVGEDDLDGRGHTGRDRRAQANGQSQDGGGQGAHEDGLQWRPLHDRTGARRMQRRDSAPRHFDWHSRRKVVSFHLSLAAAAARGRSCPRPARPPPRIRFDGGRRCPVCSRRCTRGCLAPAGPCARQAPQRGAGHPWRHPRRRRSSRRRSSRRRANGRRLPARAAPPARGSLPPWTGDSGTAGRRWDRPGSL